MVDWFNQWGFWIVFLAGFTILPYKLFTIGAGALSLALLPFLTASLVGRGARFVLEAQLVAWLGPKVEPMVRRYIEYLGWFVLAAIVIVYFFVKE